MAIQLKIGDKAPSFKGVNEAGKTIELKDYKGQKLVLYFYPKDDTPSCTNEACNLRDNYQNFISQGYQILGVSADKPAKHKKFIDKYKLPFSLLADENLDTINAYGVWGEKILFGRKYMGILRSTFVINAKGIIINIIDKVDTKEHTKQLL